MRNRWWAAAGLAAAAVVLAACGSTASSSSGAGGGSSAAAGSGTTIKTMSTSKGTVLTDSAGLTVYWFAIDTSTKSNCNASCVTFWPPLKGPATAASGVSLPGTFGTITRSDGSTQATYDGHPLYTFKQDTAAGQINGNGLNTAGGLWWAATPSGAKLAAAPQPSSSSSGGGGYGY